MNLDICEQTADSSRWLLYRHYLEDTPTGSRSAIVGSLSSPKLVAVLEYALAACDVPVRLVRHPKSSTPSPSWRGKVPTARASEVVFELVVQADRRLLLNMRTDDRTRAVGWLHPRSIMGCAELAPALVEQFVGAIQATGAQATYAAGELSRL